MKKLMKIGKGELKMSKQWTIEDEQYLRDNYDKKTVEEIASYLNRTTHAVRNKAKKMDMHRVKDAIPGVWKEVEEEYLKKCYCNTSAAEIGKKLGKTTTAVKKKAAKLGLKPEKRDGFNPWTAKEIAYLVKNYQALGLKKIAKTLKRSRSSVLHKAISLGLTEAGEARPWTDREVAYLEAKYVTQPVELTAKRLKRTMVSVQHKAMRLGLNSYASEWYNATTIASCFQHDCSVIIRWIEKHGLSAKKIVLPNQTRYLIDPDDFWEWASTHKSLINWSNYIPLSLPPEPEWVNEERKNYKNTRHRKPFTDSEKIQIKHMIRQGKTYQEIANAIGRSKNGISKIGAKLRA